MSVLRTQNARASLSKAKRRFFIFFTLAFPLVLLVLLESVLRLIHYGPDLSLFTTEVVNGKTYHVMNPEVRSRYFSDMDFIPSTSVDDFLVPKPPGTYRVFCLGGSTTVGYPYWYNGAFSTFLRDRLQRTFPDKAIDVINLGMTATNSFTVLDIAREIVAYEPDLIIVYDGHNEFYGALGVSSNESPGKSRWLTETYLKLIHFRSFILLRDAYGRARGLFRTQSPVPSRGTMMEKMSYGNYVEYGSPTYRRALAIFEENLAELKSLCAGKGVPLLLGTQVSNLRTQHPFVSTPRAGLAPPETREFKVTMEAGLDALAGGHPRRGIPFLARALALDSLRADVQFALAQCLDTSGEKNGARSAYARARDLDQLRFRASSEFNRAIIAMENGTTSGVVDMEALFAGASPDSIIGSELIFEHLHPTSRGYFLMAKGYARAMERLGLVVPPEGWRDRDTVSDGRLWNERPITLLDERMAARRVEILASGWPFRRGTPVVQAISPADTIGMIADQASRSRWTWERAHGAALAYYMGRDEWNSAENEYRAIISQKPLDIQPRMALAQFYTERGRLEEMKSVLAATLTVQPTKLAYRSLGDLALDAGNTAEAIGYYRALSGFTLEPGEILEDEYLLGLAFSEAGARDSALHHVQKLLVLNPDYAPARDLLKRIQEQR